MLQREVNKIFPNLNKLEQEVEASKLNGAMICIEMDANSKLGKEFIKKVRRKIS